MDSDPEAGDPVAAVRHVLAVLDRLDAGEVGSDVTVNTLSFLVLLRQQEVKGDLLYASPEQVRGESMDERSLVFSAGVLLFEKLTGRHPFGAEGNPNRVARIRRGELASGVNFFPKVPAALRTVLVKAMGPFPEERFDSLADLRKRLEAYVEGELDDGWNVTGEPAAPRLPAMTEPSRNSMWPKELDKPKAPVFKNRLAKPRSMPPVLWMLSGAAIASAVFLLLWPRTAAEPVATPVHVNAPAPAPAAAPVPVPVPVPAEEPEPAVIASVFDAEIGAQNALAAIRGCFSEDRLAAGVALGASLVYGVRDGLTRKIYYGNTDGIEAEERRCLSKELIGISAGGAPERNTIVVHSFWLRADGGRVKARVKE
jgi:hypothetical protein